MASRQSMSLTDNLRRIKHLIGYEHFEARLVKATLTVVENVILSPFKDTFSDFSLSQFLSSFGDLLPSVAVRYSTDNLLSPAPVYRSALRGPPSANFTQLDTTTSRKRQLLPRGFYHLIIGNLVFLYFYHLLGYATSSRPLTGLGLGARRARWLPKMKNNLLTQRNAWILDSKLLWQSCVPTMW